MVEEKKVETPVKDDGKKMAVILVRGFIKVNKKLWNNFDKNDNYYYCYNTFLPNLTKKNEKMFKMFLTT